MILGPSAACELVEHTLQALRILFEGNAPADEE